MIKEIKSVIRVPLNIQDFAYKVIDFAIQFGFVCDSNLVGESGIVLEEVGYDQEFNDYMDRLEMEMDKAVAYLNAMETRKGYAWVTSRLPSELTLSLVRF